MGGKKSTLKLTEFLLFNLSFFINSDFERTLFIFSLKFLDVNLYYILTDLSSAKKGKETKNSQDDVENDLHEVPIRTVHLRGSHVPRNVPINGYPSVDSDFLYDVPIRIKNDALLQERMQESRHMHAYHFQPVPRNFENHNFRPVEPINHFPHRVNSHGNENEASGSERSGSSTITSRYISPRERMVQSMYMHSDPAQPGLQRNGNNHNVRPLVPDLNHSPNRVNFPGNNETPGFESSAGSTGTNRYRSSRERMVESLNMHSEPDHSNPQNYRNNRNVRPVVPDPNHPESEGSDSSTGTNRNRAVRERKVQSLYNIHSDPAQPSTQ